ncbi:MAG: MYXO-CTERM sorting domain-containing protein [Kofleriaceae bacterium]
MTLRPGLNNSSLQTSSIVETPTSITPWEIDDEDWAATMACMRDMFSPFDVRITDQDPGMTDHLEAVFGGHPSDVGLPDNVAGISPFTTNCSVVENSVVFTFTDILPDDPRLMCEIMAQEIAHSYGLDHQMLAADPMSYLDYDGDRVFQDEDAFCGEYELRSCGVGGNVCRDTQNSVELLTQRLGRAGETDGGSEGQGNSTSDDPIAVGCNAGQGAGAGIGMFGFALLGVVRRRRRTSNDVARS